MAALRLFSRDVYVPSFNHMLRSRICLRSPLPRSRFHLSNRRTWLGISLRQSKLDATFGVTADDSCASTSWSGAGLSLGHNISMAAFGGTAPIIATALIKGTGSMMAPAGMLVVAGALSAVGAWLTRHWGMA